MNSSFGRLSRRAAAATPPALADDLIRRVRQYFGVHTVAILWVDSKSTLGLSGRATGIDAANPGAWSVRLCKLGGRLDGRYVGTVDPGVEYRGNREGVASLRRRLPLHPLQAVRKVVLSNVGVRSKHLAIQSINQGDWGFPSPKATLLYWWKG